MEADNHIPVTPPDIQSDQKAFMKVCDARAWPIHEVIEGTPIPEDEEALYNAIELCSKLIEEECIKELMPAIEDLKAALENDGTQEELLSILRNIFDGGIDTIYVIMQLFNTLDLPFNSGWVTVAANNMTKAIKDPISGEYKIKKREDGKILKPEGYQSVEPELMEVLKRHYERSRDR